MWSAPAQNRSPRELKTDEGDPGRQSGPDQFEMEAEMGLLNGQVALVTGASRGIGLAIAKRAAKDGANIAIAAKTKEPHPTLPGTIYTAAEEIEELRREQDPFTMIKNALSGKWVDQNANWMTVFLQRSFLWAPK